MCENNKKYKIVIAYDGTNFAGWQSQKNQKSVANMLENRFYAVFKKKITLAGASRTDAGVHAQGQVATFTTDLSITTETMRWALQRSLPASIFLHTLELISESFNPRYDVIQKIYWYHFFLQQPLPWVQNYGYHQIKPIDLVILQQALQVFVGTHDFRSFCSGNDKDNTVRTIESITLDFNEQLGAYRIIFKGRSFLRYMLRRIVGAALHIAEKKQDLFILQQALEEKNPQQKFVTAPPQGLMLHEIIYK